MKVLLYGPFGQYASELESVVKQSGLDIIPKAYPLTTNPSVVITFGGDGTLLGAERDFPGVPKLPLRNSHTSFHAIPLNPEVALRKLINNELVLNTHLKLEVQSGSENFLALNDCIIRNELPTTALRFTVSISPKPSPDPSHIGDGLVISTPFGSTGYYQSITRQNFISGIGLAFNNLRDYHTPLVLEESKTIEVEITRGPALLAIDNNPKMLKLDAGSKVEIKSSPQKAQIYEMKKIGS